MAQQAELMVIGFEGKHRAAEVLNQLQDMDVSFAIDLKDAVAVYRTNGGKLRVDQSVQPTTNEGAAWGAVIGGMIGAAIGADEADTLKRTYGISDDFVKDVGGMVQPGESAVLVLARTSNPAAVAERFRGYGGKVLRTTLPREWATKFNQVMTPATAVTR